VSSPIKPAPRGLYLFDPFAKLMKLMYYVYILKCKDRSLYTGITTDVERRFKEHQSAKGGHYTSSHPVLKILHTEKYPSRSAALKRESEIKKLARQQKLALIK
jgi:putative endonuclease